jgi:prepilin-type N-terminal cleavage/methylation domain-containing protein
MKQIKNSKFKIKNCSWGLPRKYARGFTLIELILTMGIFAVITTLVTINLLKVQHAASVSSVATTLVADLRGQQTKAITGDTEGRTTTDQYGVHFDSDKYVLFHGIYTDGEPSNFEIPLEGSLNFTTNGDVIFSKGSGELSGINTITLRDNTTNEQKVININIYGVVNSVN